MLTRRRFLVTTSALLATVSWQSSRAQEATPVSGVPPFAGFEAIGYRTFGATGLAAEAAAGISRLSFLVLRFTTATRAEEITLSRASDAPQQPVDHGEPFVEASVPHLADWSAGFTAEAAGLALAGAALYIHDGRDSHRWSGSGGDDPSEVLIQLVAIAESWFSRSDRTGEGILDALPSLALMPVGFAMDVESEDPFGWFSTPEAD